MPVIAAIVIGGTGLGLQAKATHQAGKVAVAEAKSEAAWTEYNAKLAEREALEEQEVAAVEERRKRKEGARKKARIRALTGKAGLLPIGSIEEGLKETASEIELDALLIRRGGSVGAGRLKSQADLFRTSGQTALLRGKAKKRAARTQAISGFLVGGASLGLQAKAAS